MRLSAAPIAARFGSSSAIAARPEREPLVPVDDQRARALRVDLARERRDDRDDERDDARDQELAREAHDAVRDDPGGRVAAEGSGGVGDET